MANTISNLSYKASLEITLIEKGPDDYSGYSLSITTSDFPDGREGVYIHDDDQQLIDITDIINDVINETNNKAFKLNFANYLESIAKQIKKNIFQVVKDE